MTTLTPPFDTVLKPYGTALVDLASHRDDVVCLGGDLTRQTETDLFRDTFPDRFFNAGMAEANLMGMAAGMARAGFVPFVNTFGVFCTRRPYDQVAMSIAYPDLPVRIVGFMPGLSSPGGPSHQAIDDVSLMRGLPNMTVVDVADAAETGQAVEAIADVDGPVYLRLKRGEIPVVFGPDHRFRLDDAELLRTDGEVAIVASGMMLGSALRAAEAASQAGVETRLLYVPVIKPLDAEGVVACAEGTRGVVTAENHSVVGGLGSAVAEALAEAGCGVPLRRLGVEDRFATAGSRPYLFNRFGLSTRRLLERIWELTGRTDPLPELEDVEEERQGSFEPV